MASTHKPSDLDAIVPPAQQTVLTHSAAQGIQIASIISPAYLTLSSLRRRSSPPVSPASTVAATTKSPSRLTPLLRRHVLHSFLLGPLAGLAIGAGRMYTRPNGEGEGALASEVKRDRGVRKAEDWAVIGGVLGALILPTLLLRRASFPLLALSGSSLGCAVGTVASWTQ
ncbi:hypothetical protein OF846_005382 [Rhodotorula toruloides]|nr:hypothetical protein OF846_005382 [Rhodotorula toruloides]